MNRSLADTLVLCDLDSLLLGPDGNLTQVLRDIIQLYGSRGGRLTVFSQRTPKGSPHLAGRGAAGGAGPFVRRYAGV